jgi:hypothetical protein
MIKKTMSFAFMAMFLMFATSAFAASGYSLFGDASIISPGNASANAVRTHSIDYTLSSDYYGGIDFAVPAGLTLGDLDNLATDYRTSEGCGGGSPRFVALTDAGFVWFYLEPCIADGAFHNTGNLASATEFVDHNLDGAYHYQDSYAAVQTLYGDLAVTDLYLVTDGGWFFPGDHQTVDFDNTSINGTVYTYDGPTTAAQCKNGGWQTRLRPNGTPFKNQGDCIQYVNTGK